MSEIATVEVDMSNVVPAIGAVLDEHGVSDAVNIPGFLLASFMVQTLPALSNVVSVLDQMVSQFEDAWDDED